MAAFDRSSKWLLQHHGDALLHLAGVRDVLSWRALQAEVVQPAQLPDGLLEVRRRGQPRPQYYVVEVATYPERRTADQLVRDALLVYLNYRVVPDVLAIVLRPKGRLRVPASLALPSPDGWTELLLRWKVVELWTVPAEELLATENPGLMPWAALTRFEGPPAPVVQRCRTVIDRVSDVQEHANLLAVTQVLTRLRYNDPRLLSLLGGSSIMIESPLLQELKEEWTAEARAEARAEEILHFLQYRFGQVPADVQEAVRTTRNPQRLEQLLEEVMRCADQHEFRTCLGL